MCFFSWLVSWGEEERFKRERKHTPRDYRLIKRLTYSVAVQPEEAWRCFRFPKIHSCFLYQADANYEIKKKGREEEGHGDLRRLKKGTNNGKKEKRKKNQTKNNNKKK